MEQNKFTKFVNVLDKRGKVFLAIFAILMITSIVGIVTVKIDTGFTAFMPSNSWS